MRYVKWAFLAIAAVVLSVIAFANSQFVTLRLVPGEISDFFAISGSISLPLSIVVVLSVMLGVVIGEVVEWLREHKHRAEATKQGREARRLKREVEALKSKDRKSRGEDDDVLALLEDQR